MQVGLSTADERRRNSLTSERMLLLLRVEMGGISENLSSSPSSPFSSSPFSFAAPEWVHAPISLCTATFWTAACILGCGKN